VLVVSTQEHQRRLRIDYRQPGMVREGDGGGEKKMKTMSIGRVGGEED